MAAAPPASWGCEELSKLSMMRQSLRVPRSLRASFSIAYVEAPAPSICLASFRNEQSKKTLLWKRQRRGEVVSGGGVGKGGGGVVEQSSSEQQRGKIGRPVGCHPRVLRCCSTGRSIISVLECAFGHSRSSRSSATGPVSRPGSGPGRCFGLSSLGCGSCLGSSEVLETGGSVFPGLGLAVCRRHCRGRSRDRSLTPPFVRSWGKGALGGSSADQDRQMAALGPNGMDGSSSDARGQSGGAVDPLPQGYRANVGICLVNDEDKVFIATRIDLPGSWQMPQVGMLMRACTDLWV
ncbi:hypothetical protein CBR_g4842 [Chara braunii]|uniref:Nudix hydrolase domain-containing protein n=1 Tax=Chara braunii TaxID=69332 RepID=A0A388KIY0_CHABU|nr:hypothetical protein CBR_g4842 [Chara braunii]|eukprot:GBG70015.1 hypothetical protein CBR_g4842 [Chara braunii]